MTTSNTMSKILFSLKELATDINIRASKGILILVLDDENVSDIRTYKKLKKVDDDYEEANMAYISSAFSDYGVKEVVIASGHSVNGITGSLSDTLKKLNTVYKNGWLCVPQITSDIDKKKVADFVKTQRRDEDYPIKAVLYNYRADSEGIVNFTASNLGEGITSDEYCLDVASYLCTLGSNEAITGHVAKKVTSCDLKDDNDEHVASGELFLYNDGSNIVYSTGVNSLQTIRQDQNDYLAKIRVVEVIDMVKSDLRKTFKENYLGRYGNSYKNRKSLVNVINSYLKGIAKEGFLSNDVDSYCELDVEETRKYLEQVKGIDTDDMKDDEVLRQPIDTHVFLKMTIYVMDVVEQISATLYYSE